MINFGKTLACAAALTLAGSMPTGASGAVPTYNLIVVADYTVNTVVHGANDQDQIVGTQIIEGVQRAFYAAPGAGIELLPLPAGYISAEAYDINDSGVIVGTVSTSSLASDFGEPAVWFQDAGGDYAPVIPEQFASLPGPLGEQPIDGGQIVAINQGGSLIGWSRYQGFQGGPATLFSVSGAPVDLGSLGMQALPRDVNDDGIVVGGQLKFDLSDNSVTDIGVPPPIQGGTSFTDAIIFAINDSGDSVVAANLASVPTENYLTYLHTEGDGYRRLNPDQLPSRFVGFYSINDGGDILASGGIHFAAEGALFFGVSELLSPPAANWSIEGGIIAGNRRIHATAHHAGTDRSAIVVLVPDEDTIFRSAFEPMP